MGEYWRPESVEEAVARLNQGAVTIVAGGTDVFPARRGARLEGDVLDLSAIEALRGVTESDASWRLGATSTWTDIVEADLPPFFDTLKAAAREVGGPQIQNAGTVAGNICNASPAADGVPPLLVLDAELEVCCQDGVRHMRLGDFVLGNRSTALAPGEIVTAVIVPKPPAAARSVFLKLGARRYQVISIVSVAGLIVPDSAGAVADLRLAVGSCSAAAARLTALEQRLTGQTLPADLAVDAADLAPLAPIDDCRGSAAYRRDAASVLVRRAVAELGGQIGSAG
jgi:CO/xanthine dehydrogenase FAD-binding subunit